jgi:outer membrane lipoprotein-sorting protein
MWKKVIVISLVLILSLSITACVEETEEAAGLPSAQEIVDDVIESFASIRTYQFDMVMTQDQAGEAGGEILEQTVMIDNSGTLDLENMQMSANLSMKVVTAEEADMEEAVEMYIVDSVMYAKPKAPGEDSFWVKEEVPAEGWEMLKGTSGLEAYKELLEIAQAEILGSEKVKGVDCYVLQLTTETSQLWQTIGPGGTGGGEIAPTIPEEFLQDIFRSFSIKQWIAKDTYFLMKVTIDMTAELTSELQEYLDEEGEMTMDTTLSFLAYNYNQPATIVVPPEAVEATE